MKNINYDLLSESGNKRVHKFCDSIGLSIKKGHIKTRKSAIKIIENRIISIGKKHPNIYKRDIYFDIIHTIDDNFEYAGWELYSNITEYENNIWNIIAQEIVDYNSIILNSRQADTIYKYFSMTYRSLAPSYFQSLINKDYPFQPKNQGKYPGNWSTIVKQTLLRAKNQCEKCNAQNGKPQYNSRSRIKLEIAHLDHNPQNNVESNLLALCKSCHTRHDVPLRHYLWEKIIAKWWIKEGKQRTKLALKGIKFIADDSLLKLDK